MNRRLNVKNLAYLLAALIGCGVAVHFLHGYQVERTGGEALLWQANRCEEKGDLGRAASYLDRYLKLEPADTDALARYGRMLSQLARSPVERRRAGAVLEKVLVRDPRRHDVRRQLVRLLMDQGRYQIARLADAMQHLDVLLRATPDNGELELLYGQCLEGRKEFRQAAAWLAKAVRHAPAQVEGYVRLAALLRRHLGDPPGADAVMNRLVANNRRAFPALLARARYWKEAGALDRAEKDVAEAAVLAPAESAVILASADLALERARSATGQARQKSLDEGRRTLERGSRLHPQAVAIYLALARLELEAGRPAQAVACLVRADKAVPDAVPEKSDLLWNLANLLLGEGREAGPVIAKLSERAFPAAQLGFLRARSLVNQGEWLPAVRHLEQIYPALGSAAELTKQADLLLGRCYTQLGNADQQYAAFCRVVETEPLNVTACLGMASALLALNKLDDAIVAYRKVIPQAPAAAVRVAQLMTLQNLRLPPEQRRWQEVELILDQAPRAGAAQVEATIARARVLALQGRFDEARGLLTAARDHDPNEVKLWVALAELAGDEGKPDALLAALDRAKQRLGDRVELRLARCRFWAERGGSQAVTALHELEQGLARFSRTDRQSLLEGLAQASARTSNFRDAERLWRLLAQEQPRDLGVQLALFDLALRGDDERAMQRVMADIRRVEEGSLWRYAQVCHLLWKARAGGAGNETLARAEALLRTLRAERRSWSRVAVCEGQLEELKGHPEGAIEHYLRAVMEMGEPSPAVIRRTVQLLYARRRYVEADRVLQKLPGNAPLSTDLQRIGAELSLRRQDYARAASLADQAVSPRSGDYRDHLWRGHILAAAGRAAEAEAALRRATELAGSAPDPWVALVQHLVRTGHPDKALVAIGAARRRLPRDQADLALAQCHELVGDRDRAVALFQAALAARPTDVVTMRSVAGFYVRTLRYKEAQPLLEALIERQAKSPDDAAWARRILALVLTAGGDYRQSRKALDLLGLGDNLGPESPPARRPEDERARALVLAGQRGLGQRKQAIQILERLAQLPSPEADDLFLLARLHEAVGDWRSARRWMLRLLETHSRQPAYLAHFTRSLLSQGEDEMAEEIIDRLRRLPGQAGGFLLAELEARLRAARRQPAAAVTRLESYAQGKDSKPADEADRLAMAAAVLDHLAQTFAADKGYAAAAEKMYRALVAQRPRSTPMLVSFLARQGRVEEALDLGQSAGADCPPEVVANAVVSALHTEKAGPGTFRRVEGMLTRALERDPRSAALLMCLADFRNLQGRYADAIGIYRDALRRDPRSVVGLNNLAWLLAVFEGEGKEAIQLVERAIDVAGPLPELLDTRAVAWLALGKGEQAVADLKRALEDKPQLAASYFHLAQAYVRANNPGGARAALGKAKALGFRPDQLHPLEGKAYQQLMHGLGDK
jgi:tetratricopeptide (TPR) repeat protein